MEDWNKKNYGLEKLLNQVLDVPGDIVELGVYKGATIKLLRDYLIKTGKNYYGFDTFTGYTTEDLADVTNNNIEGLIRNTKQKAWVINPNIVYTLIQDLNLMSRCKIYEGDLKIEFKKAIERKEISSIAALIVDCNAYLPALVGMGLAKNHMHKNSLIIIDEHVTGGETSALFKFAMLNNYFVYPTGYKYPDGPSKYIRIK